MPEPPIEKRRLLGLARFTEQAFTGEGAAGSPIRNGLIGDLYGIPVYVSSNVTKVLATDGTTNNWAGLLMHQDALVFINQESPRMQTQYKLEWLADLMTADTIFGGGVLRPEAGVGFMVPVV